MADAEDNSEDSWVGTQGCPEVHQDQKIGKVAPVQHVVLVVLLAKTDGSADHQDWKFDRVKVGHQPGILAGEIDQDNQVQDTAGEDQFIF